MMKLRELRKERNLRQKDVAEQIGVCTQSYGYYENGINKPDPETLIKLADFFGCSIDYLLGREDDLGHLVSRQGIGEQLTSTEKQLLDGFRRLDQTHRTRVLGYTDALLEEQKKNG